MNRHRAQGIRSIRKLENERIRKLVKEVRRQRAEVRCENCEFRIADLGWQRARGQKSEIRRFKFQVPSSKFKVRKSYGLKVSV